MKGIQRIACVLLQLHLFTYANCEIFESKNKEPVSQVAVDPSTGRVYIGAVNGLYQLNSDLKLEHSIVTPSVLDNPLCPPLPDYCNETRTPTKNIIKVLEICPKSQLLLSCGTVNQGRCTVHYDLNDITQRYDLNNSVTSFLAGQDTVVAFFGQPPVGSLFRNKMSIYSAISYDQRDPKYFSKSVSTRILEHNPLQSGNPYSIRYLYQGMNQYSAIEVLPRYAKDYIIRYIYGFEHDQYTYYVAVMRMALGSDDYHTRLIRICQGDNAYLSYVEVPLTCKKKVTRTVTKYYNIATAAHVATVTSKDASKLGIGSKDKVLFVTFGESLKRSTELDLDKGSSVCYHNLTTIAKSFKQAQLDCYNEQRGHLIEWFHQSSQGKQQCRYNASERNKIQYNDHYCGSWYNYPIESDSSMDMKHWFTDDDVFTSVAALVNGTNYSSGLVLGTKTGILHKISEFVPDTPPHSIVPLIEGSKDPIEKDWAYDMDKQHIYFLSGSKAVKFPMNSCSIYKDCDKCITSPRTSGDTPDCGWCIGQCTSQSECEVTGAWTKDSCPPVLSLFSPQSGPTQGGTSVTLIGRNFGSTEAMVTVEVGQHPCNVVSRNDTRIICQTTGSGTSISNSVKVTVNDEDNFLDDNPRGYMINGIDDSNDVLFTYKTPRVLSFSPQHGPEAGGTLVTINGTSLDIGGQCTVIVVKQLCKIQKRSDSEIVCMTSRVSGKRKRSTRVVSGGPVIVTIDNATLQTQDPLYSVFSYKENPKVESLTPTSAFISGGTNINVIGEHLQVIQKPILVLNFNGRLIKQACIPSNTERFMQCTLPSVQGVSPVSNGTGLVNLTLPLTALISFIMDNVQSVRTFYKDQHYGKIHFFDDPIFLPFNGVQELYSDDTTITIKVENLDPSLKSTLKRSVKIWIDQDECVDKSVEVNSVTCTHTGRPSDVSGDEPKRTVKLEVGNLKFDIGHIRYVAKNTAIILGICVGVVVVFLIVAVMVVLVYMKKKHLGPWKKKATSRPPSVRYLNGEVEFNEDGHLVRVSSRRNDYSTQMRNSTRSRRSTRSAESVVDEEALQLLNDTNQLIMREDLLLGEIIGQGHFGCVFKGYLTTPGEKTDTEVAVKSLQSADVKDSDIHKFLKEALIMKDFQHDNIIHLIGITICDDSLPLIVLPYMKNGDLLAYVRNENNSPTVRDLMEYCKQVAEGMTYLVEIKFVHRDLAARNCMLDDNSTVKVADFGLSRDIYERDYYSASDKQAKLPIKWMAPESMEKGIYNHKTDMWSFGVVIWELITRGVTPYPGVDNWDVLKYIKQNRRMPQPSFCPQPLYKLMRQCWELESSQRPTFANMVKSINYIINVMEDEENLYDRAVDTNTSYINIPTDDEISDEEGLFSDTHGVRKSKGKYSSPHAKKSSKAPPPEPPTEPLPGDTDTILPPTRTAADIIAGNMTGTSIQFADEAHPTSDNTSSSDSEDCETDNLLTPAASSSKEDNGERSEVSDKADHRTPLLTSLEEDSGEKPVSPVLQTEL